MTERLHFHFSLSCIGEGNGNPLQCSCLENSRDGGAWWAAVYGVTQGRTRLKRLSSSSCWDSLCDLHQQQHQWHHRFHGLYSLLLLLLSRFSRVQLCATPETAATRLPHPWDSPGKNTGVGCHFLLQCMKEKRESEVAQSCPTLCDPMDCSPPGSSVHGIFQARILGWGATAFSRAITT